MARTRTLERMNIEARDLDASIRCPAGLRVEPSGIPGCRCRIEKSVIDAAHDPSSLISFCMGDYTRCPSWRADKKHHWASRSLLDMNYAPRPKTTLVDKAAEDPRDVNYIPIPAK